MEFNKYRSLNSPAFLSMFVTFPISLTAISLVSHCYNPIIKVVVLSSLVTLYCCFKDQVKCHEIIFQSSLVRLLFQCVLQPV